MRALLCITVALSQMPAACNQGAQTPAARGGVNARQSVGRFDSRIPPPDPDKYKGVRDARDWRNPYLVIRAEGVEVILKNSPAGRQVIPCGELAAHLESLPAAAWPYGRVVAAQEIGIRRADGGDDRPIAENKARVDRVLKSLGVRVEWWASA